MLLNNMQMHCTFIVNNCSRIKEDLIKCVLFSFCVKLVGFFLSFNNAYFCQVLVYEYFCTVV